MPLVEQELHTRRDTRVHSNVLSNRFVCVVFCKSLFVFFFWLFYCLSFEFRLLITVVVSSDFYCVLCLLLNWILCVRLLTQYSLFIFWPWHILQWAGGSECRPLMDRYPSEDKCQWNSYWYLTADYWPLNKVYMLSFRLWLFLTECPINLRTVSHESQIVCMYIYQNNWKLMIYYT